VEFKSSRQACSSDSEIYLIKIHTKTAENLPNGYLRLSIVRKCMLYSRFRITGVSLKTFEEARGYRKNNYHATFDGYFLKIVRDNPAIIPQECFQRAAL